MFDSIAATGGVLLAWAVGAFVFASIGLAVGRWFGLTRITGRHLLGAFWLGYALVMLVLQWWHLWLPVDRWCTSIAIGAGVVLSFWHLRLIKDWLLSVIRERRIATVILLLLLVWTANRATGPCNHFDTGMYHMTAVRWTTEHPIVPGLGNLQLHLAFNNSTWLTGALFEAGPGHGRSVHFANTILGAAVLVQVFGSAVVVLSGGWRSRPEAVFDVALAVPLCDLIMSEHFVGHSSDTPVMVLLFFATSLAIEFLTSGAKGDSREQGYKYFVLSTLLTACVCIKKSAGGYAIAVWVIATLVWLWQRQVSREEKLLPFGWAVVVAFALVVPHTGRSVMLSGYPLFPLTSFATPVSWKMPEEQLNAQRAYIKNFGRHYYYRLGGDRELKPIPQVTEPGWYIPWVLNMHVSRVSEVVVPMMVAVFSLFAYLATFFLCRTKLKPLGKERWLLLAILAGFAQWMWMAPQPRLGMYLPPLLGGVALMLAARAMRDVLPSKISKIGFALLLIGSLLPIAGHIRAESKRLEGGPLAAVRETIVLPPGKDHGFHPLPKPEPREFVTDSGLRIFAYKTKCWDGQLPCSQSPARNLWLRKSGDVSAGFRLEGDWQP